MPIEKSSVIEYAQYVATLSESNTKEELIRLFEWSLILDNYYQGLIAQSWGLPEELG